MARILLDVPKYSQLDNQNRPHQTCSYTSMAMVMEYYDRGKNKLAALDKGQLEDEMSRYYENTLGKERGAPHEMEAFLNKYYGPIVGVRATFDPHGSRDKIRRALDSGSPVITHGYFTRSGHVVVIVGYDDAAYKGLGAYLVNDPYGECNLGVPTYQGMPTSVGPHTYSYRRTEQLCIVGDTFWIHTFNPHPPIL